MIVDLFDIDSLILADVEIAFGEAAEADPAVAAALAAMNNLPMPKGGEHR